MIVIYRVDGDEPLLVGVYDNFDSILDLIESNQLNFQCVFKSAAVQ